MNTESLQKILEFECQRGYANTSVFGGLDKFLRKWAAQAAGSLTDPRSLRRFQKLGLSSTNYAAMTPPERREWIATVLKSLAGDVTGETKRSEPRKPTVTKSTLSPRKISQPVVAQSLDSPVTIVKGISTGLAARFSKLGIKTVRDLLYFFPHRHLDYSQVKSISQLNEGKEETIIANVWEAKEARPGGRRSTEAIVGDETGNIRIVWFNNPYLARRLTTNSRIVVSGRVRLFNGRLVFESPEWEMVEDQELIHTGRLVPVYPLTQGLYPRQVRKLVKEVVDQWAGQVVDFLPADLRRRRHLVELPRAINQAHFPEDEAAKDQARTRLAFDELFLLQLGAMSRKRRWQRSQPSIPFRSHTPILENFIKSLPFELTAAQKKVLAEILTDLQKPVAMSRLLQGEVGSGKTVVAAAALLLAVASDCQGALMAPTEILAEQHFRTISQLLSRLATESGEELWHRYEGILPRPLTVALLTGDASQARKQELQQRIARGEIDIAIGTHALIQKGVDFKRLGLAVVDEQHRFGVTQRSALRQKGFNPHVLVMTATPIPRSLALTLYGDLDLSVIDELPPGRQIVKTRWLKPEQRDSAYLFIHRQVASHHQAFIICPLIEESEAVAARAAVAEYQRLSEDVFPGLRLGLLHGRMSGEEKEEAMRRFRQGEVDILVSTPVVEVGIDVPNATVMLVESADRFGLSQLHQFRGRVGRGAEQSYCMLIAQNPSEIGQERLGLIEKTHDGFALAEADLKLRGPGEFFGTRQSGLPELRMARLSDIALLETARSEA
ncbi:MAG: ATP-dependent DNA helicase RecG, partial [Dehalococcoidales bacterium]|nr:ATP-dependent DNA helicase RecG [Dehalococcoidales bacterium]